MPTLASAPLLVAALALLVPAAAGGTLEVPPGGPIQPVIDVAGPGDTVVIPAGTYFETVVVPAFRDGLSLRGKGRVVIDGLPDGAALGTVLTVRSPGVTIAHLTLRHGRATSTPPRPDADPSGHGLYAEAARVTVLDVTVLRPSLGGVSIVGDDAVVERVTCDGAGDAAVEVRGDRARVTAVTARRSLLAGITVAGDDAVVAGNRIAGFGSSGLLVEGDSARVEHNAVAAGGGDAALTVLGDDAVVRRNHVASPASTIAGWVEGARARVERNRFVGLGAEGVTVASDDGHVLANMLTGTGATTLGLLLAGDGLQAAANTLRDVLGTGLLLSGAGGTLERNRLLGCGDWSAPALDVDGADHRIAGNVVQDALGPGLRLAASDARVEGNRFLGGLSAGLVLTDAALDASVAGNLFLGLGGDAVQNRGTGTVLRRNVFRGNRLDVTNAPGAGLDVDASNRLGSGQDPAGPFPAPEID